MPAKGSAAMRPTGLGNPVKLRTNSINRPNTWGPHSMNKEGQGGLLMPCNTEALTTIHACVSTIPGPISFDKLDVTDTIRELSLDVRRVYPRAGPEEGTECVRSFNSQRSCSTVTPSRSVAHEEIIRRKQQRFATGRHSSVGTLTGEHWY